MLYCIAKSFVCLPLILLKKGKQEMSGCAALTMVWRDYFFLEKWVSHYGNRFGEENLYVVLHGSDTVSRKICENCKQIEIPRSTFSSKFAAKHWVFMSSIASMLFEKYEVVIGGDVDELIFVDPAVNQSMADYLLNRRGIAPVTCPLGLEPVRYGTENPLNPSNPVFSQRSRSLVVSHYCKPSIAYQEVNWAPGGHSTNFPLIFDENLYLAHLRYVGGDNVIASTLSDRRAAVEALKNEEKLENLNPLWVMGTHAQLWKEEKITSKKLCDFDDMAPKIRELLSQQKKYRAGVEVFKMLKRFPEFDCALKTPERFKTIL